MRIAVLGTGRVGSVLGARWAALGHEVTFGSRDPRHQRVVELVNVVGQGARALSSREAVAQSDVALLATPWAMVASLLAVVGELEGKILIDCINPIRDDFRGLDLGHDTSAAEQIAAWAPGARVVKAFNTLSAAVMADPWFAGERATALYCGDDHQAKGAVRELVEQLELEPVDAGPLAMARYLEPLAMLYIELAVRQGYGANCALKLLRRSRGD